MGFAARKSDTHPAAVALWLEHCSDLYLLPVVFEPGKVTMLSRRSHPGNAEKRLFGHANQFSYRVKETNRERSRFKDL